MTGAQVLTPEQYDEIAELIERGIPNKQIAAQFGVSIGTVTWTGLRLGADVPSHRWRPSPVSPKKFARNGYQVRQFAKEEDKKLVELEASGMGYTAIGRVLGRKPNSVRGRLLTLARHDARREILEVEG